MHGLSYEIVVVDNYSNDGTFETLMEYANRCNNIVLYRCKCSRGYGKQIALELSRGEYVIPFVDPDELIDAKMLRLTIEGYLKSRYRDQKATGLVYPRYTLEEVGWRDLNRGEDNDHLARLYYRDLLVTVPKRKPKRNVPKHSMLLPSDWYREQRYATGLNYFRRFIKNKMHMICGSGYTLRSVVQLYRYGLTRSLPYVFLSCLYHLFFISLNKLVGLKAFRADPNLSNYCYNKFKEIMTMVDPRELGLSLENTDVPSANDAYIQFISRFHPEVSAALKRLQLLRAESKSAAYDA